MMFSTGIDPLCALAVAAASHGATPVEIKRRIMMSFAKSLGQ
jgi:hypothetical protein